MPRLRTIGAMLCLAACAAVVALWARRSTRADVVAFCSPAGHWQAAASTRDGLAVFTSAIPAGREWAWRVRSVSVPSADFDDAYVAVFDPTNVHNSLGGFKLASGTFPIGPQTPGFRAALVPHWAVALPLAVPPLLWARGQLRRRRWRKQGRCRHCGYDMRGSPERCPECGKPGATAAAGAETPRTDVAANSLAADSGEDQTGGGLRATVTRALVVLALLAPLGGATVMVGRGAGAGAAGADGVATVVGIYDASDFTDELHWPPGRPPRVRVIERAEDDPDRAQSGAGMFGWGYKGPYPRVMDERVDRIGALVDVAYSFAPDADTSTDAAARGDQIVLVGPPIVHAQFLHLLNELREPAAATTFLTLVAGQSAPAAAAPTSRSAQDADEKLALILPEVELNAVTLEAAIEQLAEQTRANIVADWKQLAAVDVEPDTVIKLRLWDLSLERTLFVVLSAAGGDRSHDTESPYTVQADDGVIRVSTRAASGTVTRIYDVRKLMEQSFASKRALIQRTGGPPPRPTSTRPAPSLNQRSEDDYSEYQHVEEEMENLATFLKETIDPDAWRDNGGSTASMREWAGRFFITHSPEGHRQVEAALKLLSDEFGKD